MLGNSMFRLIQYEFKIIHFIWVVCILRKTQRRTHNPSFLGCRTEWGSVVFVLFLFFLANFVVLFLFVDACNFESECGDMCMCRTERGQKRTEEVRESEEVGSHVLLMLSRPPTSASFVFLPIAMFHPEPEFLGKPIFAETFLPHGTVLQSPSCSKLSFHLVTQWREGSLSGNCFPRRTISSPQRTLGLPCGLSSPPGSQAH